MVAKAQQRGAAPGRRVRRARRARVSRAVSDSRAAREREEQALAPAGRLALALELSDLCESLAAAGRRARELRR